MKCINKLGRTLWTSLLAVVLTVNLTGCGAKEYTLHMTETETIPVFLLHHTHRGIRWNHLHQIYVLRQEISQREQI